MNSGKVTSDISELTALLQSWFAPGGLQLARIKEAAAHRWKGESCHFAL